MARNRRKESELATLRADIEEMKAIDGGRWAQLRQNKFSHLPAQSRLIADDKT